MAFNISEILEVGPGWNKVRLDDGNVVTLQGNYNWRSNNPGNIEWGPFAESMGAIGEGAVPKGRQRGFAIFPSIEAGQAAREKLQFESASYLNADNADQWGHNYPKGSIGAAIYRYAPPTENDTEGYIRAVAGAAGVDGNTLMSDLSPEQRRAFMDAQQHHEGWKQGDMFNEAGVKLPPGEIPNTVGTMLDVQPSAPKVAPTPAPRSELWKARQDAIVNQPPAEAAPIPESRAEMWKARQNAIESQAPDAPGPLPLSRAEMWKARQNAIESQAPGLGGTARGNTAPPSNNGGMIERAPAPASVSAPRPVARTPATATERLEGAPDRSTLVRNGESYAGQEATNTRPTPLLAGATPTDRPQSFAGQDAGKGQARLPTLAPPPEIQKYIETTTQVPLDRKSIPLGDVAHGTSRDGKASAEAGKKLAESEQWKTVTRRSLNPEWVKQQREQNAAVAPGVTSRAPAEAAAEGIGLGQGKSPQIIYGASTGRPYEVGKTYENGNGSAVAQADGTFKRVVDKPATAAPSSSERGGSSSGSSSSSSSSIAKKNEPSFIERVRTTLGMPAEGLAPGIQRSLGLGGGSGGGQKTSTPTRTPQKSGSTQKSGSDKNTSPGGHQYDRTTGTWI